MYTEKRCNRCKVTKPLAEFYIRSGISNPIELGHYTSECKTCMSDRNKYAKTLDATEPRAFTEVLGINYLKKHGIPCLPGKAVSFSHVDIVAFGCVEIEVKFSRLDFIGGAYRFKFTSSPKQVQRGYLADAILLICEYSKENTTYHVFDVNHPVFYINGHVKNGMNFMPGATEALKHGNNRVVMTQPIMDEHQDNIEFLWNCLERHCEQLKQKGVISS